MEQSIMQAVIQDMIEDLNGNLKEMNQIMVDLNGQFNHKVQICTTAMSQIDKDFKNYEQLTMLHLEQLRNVRGLYVDDTNEHSQRCVKDLDKMIADHECTMKSMSGEKNSILAELEGIFSSIKKNGIGREDEGKPAE